MELHYLKNLLQECSVTLIFTSIFLLLTIVYKVKNRNLPPGPTGLPFLGYWPFLSKKKPHFQLEEFTRKYGDVFSFTVVGHLNIYLGSNKVLREALVTKSDNFAERAGGFSTLTCFFQEGIISSNGDKWKTLRKFFVQKFREFGVTAGKDNSGVIIDAIEKSMESIRSTNGTPTDILSILNLQYSTVLRRMFFNDDCASMEDLSDLIENYDGVVDIFTNKNILLNGSFAKNVILAFDKGFQNSLQLYKKLEVVMTRIINKHKDTFDEQSVRNVIDSFYKEKNERAKKNDPTAKYFTDKALASSMLQFVGDGILGVAAYITFFIQALIEYPDEQDKIFKELEEVVGRDNQPTLDHKSKLPYTNAFFQEVMRTSDFLTYFPGLKCTKETTISGYRIPEGALTISGFWTINRDPRVYHEPNTFNPSRFLKQEGRDKAEASIMFGVGKRACAGEFFAQSQTFLLITALVKNFRLEVPKGGANISFLEGRREIVAHARAEK